MATYRFLRKSTNVAECIKTDSVTSLAAFMLGMSVYNYIIIKTDFEGDRIFDPDNFNKSTDHMFDCLELAESLIKF
jgi:hypothetical protein